MWHGGLRRGQAQGWQQAQLLAAPAEDMQAAAAWKHRRARRAPPAPTVQQLAWTCNDRKVALLPETCFCSSCACPCSLYLKGVVDLAAACQASGCPRCACICESAWCLPAVFVPRSWTDPDAKLAYIAAAGFAALLLRWLCQTLACMIPCTGCQGLFEDYSLLAVPLLVHSGSKRAGPAMLSMPHPSAVSRR